MIEIQAKSKRIFKRGEIGRQGKFLRETFGKKSGIMKNVFFFCKNIRKILYCKGLKS